MRATEGLFAKERRLALTPGKYSYTVQKMRRVENLCVTVCGEAVYERCGRVPPILPSTMCQVLNPETHVRLKWMKPVIVHRANLGAETA